MTLKRLFLSHYSGDVDEVSELATELRLRGIIPWVDRDGGFSIGDELETEARRAIREDCFGLLLYATNRVFDRPFIRNVEIAEAKRVRESNSNFVLFAVPRGIGFDQLERRSLEGYGVDLSAFHSIGINQTDGIGASLANVAYAVLERFLSRPAGPGPSRISLQYSTREIFPNEPDDLLCVDATHLLAAGVGSPDHWNRLVVALVDIKKGLSRNYGRPRLTLHGSKHLVAAFAFGRVFAPFEMDIRQTNAEVWSTDAPALHAIPFVAMLKKTGSSNKRLFVEVASGYKNVSHGVSAYLAEGGPQPSLRLQLRPRGTPLSVNNSLCLSMARQTYVELERTCQSYPVDEIHLFAAAPQPFMMMLGRQFKGMPPVHLYEWTDQTYVCCCCIPGGVL